MPAHIQYHTGAGNAGPACLLYNNTIMLVNSTNTAHMIVPAAWTTNAMQTRCCWVVRFGLRSQHDMSALPLGQHTSTNSAKAHSIIILTAPHGQQDTPQGSSIPHSAGG
jgi:hypothetical protein